MSTFNINGALQRLVSNANAHSLGYCAKYVRTAMEAGGLNTSTRPDWAWKYINWLPTQGWKLMTTCSSRTEQALYTQSQAQPGDIAVYQKPGYGTTAPGHICMWSGRNWISDFVQSNMNVYSGETNIYIFRYTGDISNNGDLIDTSFSNASSFTSTGNQNSQSGLVNGAPNTVYKLASNGEREDVLKLSDGRKSQFEAMREKLKNNSVDMGRDIIESPEMYNSSILKTTQSAKQMRTSKTGS